MSNKRVIFEAQIERILDHTPDIRELFLKTKNGFQLEFRAGQFVMMQIPQPDKPAQRAYSIASDHHKKDGFDLLFKKVPNGLASTYVWNLKNGDTLQFTGPFGRLFFHEPISEQIIFMNTGSGVAQHLSYLRSFHQQYPEMKCTMYFGLYKENEIYYTKELEALKKLYKNFNFHYVLSEPSSQWKGRKGYVQHFLNETNYKNIETSFFLCGNGAMIRDTKKILIEEDKIDSAKIHSEAFH